MRLLALIGGLAVAAGLAAAGFFFGGFFDISTTWEDPAPVTQAIARVRDASIARRATDRPPADFSTPGRAQAGAKAFAKLGCANCHGAPGVKWQTFSEGMNPAPPDLKEEGGKLTPAQIFWVAKHGIRMTGMPAFGAAASDDELWSLAAFVKKLPDITEADFKAWTAQAPADAPKQ